VLALSLITNMAAGLSDEKLSHAHTLASAAAASTQAVELLRAIIEHVEEP
jgi:purine-nucleoside phosphorylase